MARHGAAAERSCERHRVESRGRASSTTVGLCALGVLTVACASPAPVTQTLSREQAYSHALALWGAGRSPEAHVFMDERLRSDPDDQRLLFFVAAIYRAQWMYEEAASFFLRALEIDEATTEGIASRLVLELDAGRGVEPAYVQLRKLADEHRDDPILRWMTAVMAHSQRNFAEAAQQYARLVPMLPVGDHLVFHAYANVLHFSGQYEVALPYRYEALKLAEHDWAYARLGDTLTKLGRFEEADRAYAKMMELEPQSGWEPQWGWSYAARGEPEKAIEVFERVLARDPYHRDAFMGAAVVYQSMGNDARIEQVLLTAAHADNPEAQLELANRVYFNRSHEAYDPAEGLRWLTEAADQGYPAAERALGYRCEVGLGMPRDYECAATWYRKAIAHGEAPAAALYGTMLLEGRGVEKDEAQGWRLCLGAARSGDGLAQYHLSTLYRRGIYVDRDAERERYWLLQAAEKGITDAQRRLFTVYTAGEGVAKNLDEASKWLEAAARGGDTSAQLRLARSYMWGLDGSRKDRAQARYWTAQAAMGGNLIAMRALGLLLRDGHGGPADPEQAVVWLRRAADRGELLAEVALGLLLLRGEGTEQDVAEGLLRLERAALAGFSDAQAHLATVYSQGELVTTDRRTALRWGRMAAEGGQVIAQHHMAAAYLTGDGVAEDPEEAMRWFELAALQGDTSSQFNLGIGYLQGKGRIRSRVHAYAWLLLAAPTKPEAAKAVRYLEARMPAAKLEKARRMAGELEREIERLLDERARQLYGASLEQITAAAEEASRGDRPASDRPSDR